MRDDEFATGCPTSVSSQRCELTPELATSRRFMFHSGEQLSRSALRTVNPKSYLPACTRYLRHSTDRNRKPALQSWKVQCGRGTMFLEQDQPMNPEFYHAAQQHLDKRFTAQ